MPEEWADGLWRSEDMVLLIFRMQREFAYPTIAALGGMGGKCMFRDRVRAGVPRHFQTALRRVADVSAKLQYLAEVVGKTAVPTGTAAAVEAPVDSATFAAVPPISVGTSRLDALERRVEEVERDVRQHCAHLERCVDAETQQRDLLELLESREDFHSVSLDEGLSIARVHGVIPVSKLPALERLISRATRGNFLLRTRTIEAPYFDPSTSSTITKACFAVFTSAPRARQRLVLLCESTGARVIALASSELPPSAAATAAALRRPGAPADAAPGASPPDTAARAADVLRELTRTVGATNAALSAVLASVRGALPLWRVAVDEEKAVYDALNLMSWDTFNAAAEAWVPRKFEAAVRTVAAAACTSGAPTFIGEVAAAGATPPTYFATNKFTQSFQDVVDSYGTPRYKEVNPGVFTIVTFPYLFAVMFGDVGHGCLLIIIASLLCGFEKKLFGVENEMFQLLFGGRYLLLLMSLFSFAMGFLYNDFVSLSLETFGPTTFPDIGEPNMSSCDDLRDAGAQMVSTPPRGWGLTYPIGFDPGWAGATNRIDFVNSVKMKHAVVVGVVQMLVGIALAAGNHIRFREKEKVWFEVLPMLCFLVLTFGYMDVMIIIKWLIRWDGGVGTNAAPALLQVMTAYFLSPGTRPMTALADGDLFPGQYPLQRILVIVAFLSVPMILIPIPCIKWRRMAAHSTPAAGPYASADHPEREMTEVVPGSPGGAAPHAPAGGAAAGGAGGAPEISSVVSAEEGESHSLSEVIIHQVIHTIEFVLGCVSNTASYLRLWALSLAHSQLSEVFFEFTFYMPLGMATSAGAGGVIMVGGFAAWFVVTLLVLVGMEGLSAFLHSLRLHWVEFQNKFYAGTGSKFVPFDLVAIRAAALARPVPTPPTPNPAAVAAAAAHAHHH